MTARTAGTTLAVLTSIVAGHVHAQAPVLVSADVSAVSALTPPQTESFGWGARGSAAALLPLVPCLLAELRLEAGLLADGPTPPDATRIDPGVGGLFGASLGLRLRLRGLYDAAAPRRADGPFLALDAGAGLTGTFVRPLFSVAVGWAFEVGPVDLGPRVGFAHLVHFDDPLDDRGAFLLSFGLEVVVPDEPREPPVPTIEPVAALDAPSACVHGDEPSCGAAPAPAPEPVAAPADTDADGILDADDACPFDPETVNGIEDTDGCPDEGLITMVEGRIVLEERVLFAFARSRVRHAAIPTLAAIVELWRQHPEWRLVRIEGHADERGSDEVNLELSTRRAERVRDALIELGMPPELLVAEGFGATRPRDTRDTEAAMEANRRVEFVVVDDGSAP